MCYFSLLKLYFLNLNKVYVGPNKHFKPKTNFFMIYTLKQKKNGYMIYRYFSLNYFTLHVHGDILSHKVNWFFIINIFLIIC